VLDYLQVGRELNAKISASLWALCDQPVAPADWDTLAWFQSSWSSADGLFLY